jgi:CubicO group peptidase (beta-lactamase class C family)
MAPSYKIRAVMAVLLLPSAIFFACADDLIDQLERQIPGWLERFEVPGASIVLIRDARIIWAKGFGEAVAGEGSPMQVETVCRVGAISQSLTAWGVMKLAEENRIDLNAPIGRYLSRWELPPSQFDHSKVTIRRLLSHSAGILHQEYPGHSDAAALPTLKEVLSGVVYDMPPVRVVHEPGTRFLYSEPGYTLLELLIEEVTGIRFGDYMHRTVFEPLNMQRSYFVRGEIPDKDQASAHGPHEQPFPHLYSAQLAATGLHTTARDLARFVAAGLPSLRGAVHGYPVLKRSTIQRMQKPIVKVKNKYHLGAEAQGLGYFVEKTDKGFSLISNGGYMAPGWYAQFLGVPQTGDGLVILTNSYNGRALINAITEAWATDCDIGQPQMITSLNKIHHFAWSTTLGGSLLSLWLFFSFIQALFKGKLTVARRYWFLRLAGLSLIGIGLHMGWTTLQRFLTEWLPLLTPWPCIALSALGGSLALWLLVSSRTER